MDDGVHPLVQGLAALVGIATAVWATWCTVVAFTGGTMPLLGWETEGGVGFGLLWLVVLEPVAITVAYWVVMVVLAPLVVLLARRRPPR